MFCSIRPAMRSKRLFCSSSSLSSLQSRPSSNIPPSTGVLYQRKPVPKNPRSPIYGFSAPSTAGISPVDVAYSRFMNRHGPLEVANRLLKMAEKKEQKHDVWGESITWQSATGSEYELQRIPHQALTNLRSSSTPLSTNGTLWNKDDDMSEDDEGEESQFGEAVGTPTDPSSHKFSGKVVVVPMGNKDISGKDFYENLMSAVQDGLEKIEDYEMTSTKRKRRLKMNKHKFKKRRKEQESLRKKQGRS